MPGKQLCCPRCGAPFKYCGAEAAVLPLGDHRYIATTFYLCSYCYEADRRTAGLADRELTGHDTGAGRP